MPGNVACASKALEVAYSKGQAYKVEPTPPVSHGEFQHVAASKTWKLAAVLVLWTYVVVASILELNMSHFV